MVVVRQPSFYVYVPYQEIHPINIWEDLGAVENSCD